MGRTKTNQNRNSNISVETFWEKSLYYGLFLFVKVLSLLPFKILYVFSDIFYYPLYYIIRYRRQIVRRNLTESFPNKNLKEIVQIEKKFYHFFMDTVLESVKLLSVSDNEISNRMHFVNVDTVNEMLDEGKSIAMFLGHYGNWEWLSTTSLHTVENAVVALVYHKLRNKPMNRLIKKLRERTGGICVNMNQTVRFMAGVREEGKPCMIGFIADQSPKKREAKHFLRFLNHNVPVLTGSEKATKHFGYEAMFVSMKRIKRGYYQCTFLPLHKDPKSLPDFELTHLYYKRLEQEIVETPELYLWTHNRFKHAE